MNNGDLICWLQQVRMDLRSDPTKSKKPFRQDWFMVAQFLAKANKEQFDSIVGIVTDLIKNSSVVTSDGMELLIPPIWDQLVIQQNSSTHETEAFHILSCLVRLNPKVDFGGSLPQVLGASAKFLYTTSTDVRASLTFVEVLLSHAAERKIDVSSSARSLLRQCTSQLDEPQADSWKYLLLASRLLHALAPVAHRTTAQEGLQTLVKFILNCLQIKELLEDATYRYAIFEVLLALSCHSGSSLDWLREHIVATGSNGESFAVFMTSLTIELRLQLTHFMAKDSQTMAQVGTKGYLSSKEPSFKMDPNDLQKILLDRCLRLFHLGLVQMNQSDTTDSNASSQPLAEFLEDSLAERLWLQLCDLGEVFRTELKRFSSEVVGILDSTNWNCSTSETSFPYRVQDVELAALLMKVYLKWTVLYYKTHHKGLLVQYSDDELVESMNQLQLRLVQQSLDPAMDILCPMLHVYFSDELSDNPQLSQQICDILSSLALLFTMFPNLPLVPTTSFTRSDRTLADVIFQWISSNLPTCFGHSWGVQSDALVATLVILNSLLLSETKQFESSSGTPSMSLRQSLLRANHLRYNLLDLLPDPKKKISGLMLELCGEVLVLSILHVRELLYSEQSPGNSEQLINRRLIAKLNGYIPLLQERFEEDEQSTSTFSRLRQALSELCSVEPSFEPTLRKMVKRG